MRLLDWILAFIVAIPLFILIMFFGDPDDDRF